MRLAYLRARGLKQDITPDLFGNREWIATIVDASQTKFGAQWIEQNDQLAITTSQGFVDVEVASEFLSQQLHADIIRKAHEFSEIVGRLDNQPG